MPRCLFLLSFNRPDYLQATLDSLQQQTDRNWQIFLYQDGPRKDRLGTDVPGIEQCLELFRERFPEGRIVCSECNLGIGLNMLAAQRHAFGELGLDVAYFFEDDLVLHPRYVEQLVLLEEVFRPHQTLVPYFAGYGAVHTVTLPQSALVSSDLRFMEHFWAFGLFRSHWEEEQTILKGYFDYLTQVDYSQRDNQLIQRMFRNLGWAHPHTSQDGARTVGLCVTKRCAISTRQPMAHYIGQSGTHWNDCDYKAWGFSNVRPADDAIPVAPVFSEENAQELAEGFRHWVCERNEFALLALRRSLKEAESDMIRMHHRIRAMEGSTSWRVTAPLRSIADSIRRISQ
ncbi:MAG: glycosyltransferase [Chthoniobacterales bacterium]|nr:glycosyltransferase [Chthoniobacterales bacterium]